MQNNYRKKLMQCNGKHTGWEEVWLITRKIFLGQGKVTWESG